MIGPVFSQQLIERLGPVRAPDEPIEQRHKDLAASMQAMFEEAFFALANALYEKTKNPRFCLAGGCGYNSVANGLVFDRSPFRDLYIQAAAGDAGGAIGAAYWVWNEILGNTQSFVMDARVLGSGVRRRRDRRRRSTRAAPTSTPRTARSSACATSASSAAAPPRRSRTATSSAGFRGGWSGARARSATAPSSAIRAAPT